ncbi:MAG: ABC transporter ATP-binding protein [Clostridium sp.]|nr:ABC transporter ATP-binding protein [Clostridium sp.]
MNAIEIKNLCKSYKNFKIDNLNLTLPGGYIMGLVGENGAGKSTTIKLILDMVHKDSGSIKVLGRDNGDKFELTKQDIGVVLDESGFSLHLNAGEIDKVMSCLYKNWSSEQFNAYLKKLCVPTDKRLKDFSRGMKMKMSIAAALSHDAKLLILDEATNGLDPIVRDEVTDLLMDFTRDENHSVLISSHIVSDLEKICDYIAFIHNGKVVLCEEKDRLTEDYAIIHCTEQQYLELNQSAVIGKRKNTYGVTAVVKRNEIPRGVEASAVTIEELFVFMLKEEE